MTVFKTARIKLTLLYLLVIMVVSLSFSLVIYGIMNREMERFTRSQRFRLERRMFIPEQGWQRVLPPDPDLLQELRARLLMYLGFINLAILVAAGLLGYSLAGWTLRPIANMLEDQSRFISDASHELKTPLTALKSSFEVFLRDLNPTISEARELIRDGVNDVDNLTKLVSSLFTLSHFSETNLQVPPELANGPVDLSLIIFGVVETLKPLAEKRGVSFDLNLDSANITGDKQKLAELFTILLDNAIKYNKEGGKVSIKLSKTYGYVLVDIKDTGIGISTNDLPRIFDRFYRADASRTRNNVEGYGLGLAIAKKIADFHKASITVSSQVNVGTTFQLKFRAGT